MLVAALSLTLAGCGDSTGPDQAGRYAFTWQEETIGRFVPEEVQTLTGTVDVTPTDGENITLVFHLPFVEPIPETGVWLGSSWQIFFVGEVPHTQSETGSFYTFSLALHWRPDGTCTGQMNIGSDRVFGTCTFTRESP